MPLDLANQTKEIQVINPIYLYQENPDILKCYEHFKGRWHKRFSRENADDLHYKNWWDTWIVFLRGDYLFYHNDRMFRSLGHYLKDKIMYKVIYTKITEFDLWAPVTLYEVEDQKTRCLQYKTLSKNKRDGITR